MNIEDLYRLLRTGHVQAQGIVDTVADPLIVLDPMLCVQNANRAFFDTFKVERDEAIGRRLYELGNGQWDIPGLRTLLMDVIPKSTALINYEVEHDFPALGKRTMLLTARTLYHATGPGHTMLLSVVDATDLQRRDLAKDMLFGELRHRMKNLLGVINAIATQSTTKGRTADEYRDIFTGRLRTFVDAEDMAFSEQGPASLDQLLKRILARHPGAEERVAVEPGDPFELTPHQVLSLSLVLHELITNAVKFGALSAPAGRVRVKWRVEESNTRLRMDWTETGGPPPNSPPGAGFGARLIKSTITHNLQGQLEQEYAPEGYRAHMVIPLTTPTPVN